jgi:dienelactone hydrolase
MRRNLIGFVFGLLASVALLGYATTTTQPTYNAAACASPPLKTAAARQQAIDEGYELSSQFDCVDRVSFEQVNFARAEAQRARQAAAEATLRRALPTLAQARKTHVTQWAYRSKTVPLPDAPMDQYSVSYYRGGDNRVLPGFVSANPADGLRHAAVIWLGDGDSNSLGKFWLDADGEQPEHLRSLVAAGIVVMHPVLRGGNNDTGQSEGLYGEVDDVLGAVEHLQQLGFVDPNYIYLAGHGSGATLAMLAAESGVKVAGVFAFDPVAEFDERTAATLFGDQFNTVSKSVRAQELRLRSPMYWLHGVTSPTYVLTAALDSAFSAHADKLCAQSENEQVRCIRVEGADHASVVGRVSTVIAARLAYRDSKQFDLHTDDFAATRVVANLSR